MMCVVVLTLVVSCEECIVGVVSSYEQEIAVITVTYVWNIKIWFLKNKILKIQVLPKIICDENKSCKRKRIHTL